MIHPFAFEIPVERQVGLVVRIEPLQQGLAVGKTREPAAPCFVDGVDSCDARHQRLERHGPLFGIARYHQAENVVHETHEFQGGGVGFAVDQHEFRVDVAVTEAVEVAAHRVIVSAVRQGHVGRKHSGDCGDQGIEAVATSCLLFAFKIPSEVTGRLSRSHHRGSADLSLPFACRAHSEPDPSSTASKLLVPLTEFDIKRSSAKAVLIYRRTGNLRAVQLLLGHMKIESTVRYLGIEVDDAIEIAEKIDI